MYGYDTKSWRNSTEHRQVKREQKDTTTRYLLGEIRFEAPDLTGAIMCRCDRVSYPHDPQFWHGSPWPQVWTPRATATPTPTPTPRA